MFAAHQSNSWKFLEPLPADASSSAGWLMMSPVPVVSATIAYVAFVCVIGPAVMRYREPFQLKNVIRFYNLIMVLAAAVLSVRLREAIGPMSTFVDCSKTFTFADDHSKKIYYMASFILSVRLTEYLDTIFFTLRKKRNQITFLHVWHHAFVPLYAYWILRTAPLRFNLFIITINSAIHVLMYFYYFLATYQQPAQLKDSNQKARQLSTVDLIISKLLMFKKYMTQLQILQFITLGAYTIWAALQPNQCNVPWTYLISNFLLAGCFLGLFVHFYLQAYNASAKAASARAKQS